MIRTNENARWQAGADTAETYIAKHTARRGIKQRAKAVIVGMAVKGLLPNPAADWLMRRLHPDSRQ
jgi:hypothetical protein